MKKEGRERGGGLTRSLEDIAHPESRQDLVPDQLRIACICVDGEEQPRSHGSNDRSRYHELPIPTYPTDGNACGDAGEDHTENVWEDIDSTLRW